jgi:hypothetical protein
LIAASIDSICLDSIALIILDIIGINRQDATPALAGGARGNAKKYSEIAKKRPKCPKGYGVSIKMLGALRVLGGDRFFPYYR